MFCEEPIKKVYFSLVEDDSDAFLDCYHDLAYHCTEGFRIVLETDNYFMSLASNGVTKEQKEGFFEREDGLLQNGVEVSESDEMPWLYLETTLFVGERLLSVVREKDIFLVQFDDFLLKIIPHKSGDDILGLHNNNHWSFNYILGCERHLKQKCPHCGGTGEILLDFVKDYVVRCKNCKRSTYAGMNLIDAITDWNNGEVPCDLPDISIE